MPVITLPPSLREEFPPHVCDGLLELVKIVQEDQRDEIVTIVRDNFGRQVAESESRLRVEIAESESRLRVEIAESESRLRVEIAESEGRLNAQISGLRVEVAESQGRLRNEIGQLRAEFSEKLMGVKTSLLAWMFVFWIGQAATVIGMMALLLKR